jgi:regulator of cell morphogenesis and NO signaling
MNELNSAIETSAMKIAPWTDSVLEAMMGHLIRTRKSLIHENLPRIEHLANSVGSCDCHDQPNAAEVADLAGTLVREIPSHLSEESESLFPAIRDLELAYVGEGFRTPTPDSVRRSVAQMVHEHDVFGQHLSMIQTLTVGNAVTEMDCDPYRQLCEKLTDLDRELRLEVHLENNILFNRALRISKALYG